MRILFSLRAGEFGRIRGTRPPRPLLFSLYASWYMAVVLSQPRINGVMDGMNRLLIQSPRLHLSGCRKRYKIHIRFKTVHSKSKRLSLSQVIDILFISLTNLSLNHKTSCCCIAVMIRCTRAATQISSVNLFPFGAGLPA